MTTDRARHLTPITGKLNPGITPAVTRSPYPHSLPAKNDTRPRARC